MKRIGGLFDTICCRDTLAAAAWRAARGKRERPEVRAFMAALEPNLAQIRARLLGGLDPFSSYTRFEVRDTKRRTIHAPSFRDRVVHHAIMAVAGPVLERGAIAHSYACRAGRGQHAALRQARQWLRRDDWYGKMDVRRFYDSIDHQRLRHLLHRRFRERALLTVFDHLLASFEHSPGRGLPIGALSSQYLGNFYLDAFDYALKRSGQAHRYLRYMDDSLVIGDRQQIDRVRCAATECLAGLGLELKHGGEWNRAERGVPFLGFVLYPDRLRLNPLGRRRYRRKQRALAGDFARGRIDDASAQARATALNAHAAVADDRAWRRVVHRIHDFGDLDRSPERDTPEPRAGGSRRRLGQHRQELPCRVPQQEPPRQQEPQPGLSRGCVPRHEDGRRKAPSTDGACSCSTGIGPADETSRKPPPDPEIRIEHDAKNRSGGAASTRGGRQDA